MIDPIYAAAIETVFLTSLQAANPFYADLCTKKDITGRDFRASQTIDLASIGTPDRLVPYSGTPHKQRSIRNISYTLRTEVWEHTMALEQTEDMNGADSDLAANFATVIADQLDEAFFSTVVSNPIAYDGTKFFAASRTGAFAGNVNVKTPTGTDGEHILADLEASLKLLLSMKADNGKTQINRDLSKLAIMCPIQLWGVFQTILNSAVISATDNWVKGLNIKLYPTPMLSSATDWYLFSLDNSLRLPFASVFVKEPVVDVVEPDQTNKLARPGLQGYCNYGFAAWDFNKAILVGTPA